MVKVYQNEEKDKHCLIIAHEWIPERFV